LRRTAEKAAGLCRAAFLLSGTVMRLSRMADKMGSIFSRTHLKERT